MAHTIIARRYAKALLDVARQHNLVTPYLEELQRLAVAMEVAPELLPVLADEGIRTRERQAVARNVAVLLECGPMVTNLLSLLIDKRRMEHLPHIVHLYRQLVDDMRGVVEATVTTAATLIDTAILTQIESILGRLTQHRVRIVATVDPALIGGVAVRVGDHVYDGSIASQLRRMRQELLIDA
ncbi:MAG: ATP synthase F1 subunit delta [Deltaproteobacteria bacterium]|nr:ATP synthase F1 subunit delta [Deltaproteobacteria bacterium]